MHRGPQWRADACPSMPQWIGSRNQFDCRSAQTSSSSTDIFSHTRPDALETSLRCGTKHCRHTKSSPMTLERPGSARPMYAPLQCSPQGSEAGACTRVSPSSQDTKTGVGNIQVIGPIWQTSSLSPSKQVPAGQALMGKHCLEPVADCEAACFEGNCLSLMGHDRT